MPIARRNTIGTFLAAAMLLVNGPASFAQDAATVLVANPEAVECRFRADDSAARPLRYEVELFAATDPQDAAAPPVMSFELAGLERTSSDTVRLNLKDALASLPDGAYVATVRAITESGPMLRSRPTAPFTVFRNVRNASVPFIESSPEEQRRERFWTRVAVAIGAGVFAVPLLFR